MAQSARELTAVTWGQELAIALRQCDASLRYCDDPDSSEAKQPSLHLFGRRVKSALRDVWKESATDVFDIGYISSRCRASCLQAVLIGPRKRLCVSIDWQRK